MSEREAFIRRICEEPHEDTHRLVFADWLDENGEPERAEFIRVQVKLSEWNKSPCECRARRPGDPTCDRCRPVDADQLREDRLFSGNWKQWRIDQDAAHGLGPFEIGLAHTSDYADHTHNLFFVRGFVGELLCDCNVFERRAEEFFRAYPITRVLLMDRLPRPIWVGPTTRQSRYVWDTVRSARVGAHSVIPEVLHADALHVGPAEAWEWLSARCVALGRALAGLPDLEPRKVVTT